MVKVSYYTTEEAKAKAGKPGKRKIIAEYEDMLRKVQPGQGGEISSKEEKEKPVTIKNRVKRVAKSLGISDLKVRYIGEEGDVVQFYRD